MDSEPEPNATCPTRWRQNEGKAKPVDNVLCCDSGRVCGAAKSEGGHQDVLHPNKIS